MEVISYGICLSLSDWLHLVWSSLGPPMLLQMALFHSFLWLSNIPLCVCVCVCVYIYIYVSHIFLVYIPIHSSIDGHLGCFPVLAVVNSATMNIRFHVSFRIRVFVFSGYMLRGNFRFLITLGSLKKTNWNKNSSQFWKFELFSLIWFFFKIN